MNINYRLLLSAGFIQLVAATAIWAQASSGVLREVWTGISGNDVEDLTSHIDYPDRPLIRDILPSFEAPVYWHSNYGTRLRAYLTVPIGAFYYFAIAGDDNCELYLSSDSNPANASLIAEVPGYTNHNQFNKYSEQQSDFIYLEAGETYYIEALHKEGHGGDHISVAWALQNSAILEIISGHFLTPFEDAPTLLPDNPIFVDAGEDFELFAPRRDALLLGTALHLTDRNANLTATWSQVSGATVTLDDASSLETEASFPGSGTYVMRLNVSDGTRTVSDEVEIVVLPSIAENTGSVTQEIWLNISGREIDDLFNSPDYPLHPHVVRQTSELSGPRDYSDRYGTRTRGLIYPPTSGNYNFAVSGNERVQFKLSTDDNPDNATLIAYTPSATSYLQWNKYPNEQISDSIYLEAGTPYYFELLHKEHYSSDHHNVAWSLEGGSFVIIGGEFLAPGPAGEHQDHTPAFDTNTDFVVDAGDDLDFFNPQNFTELEGRVLSRYSSVEPESVSWTLVEGPGNATIESPNTLSTSVRFRKYGEYRFKLSVTVSGDTQEDTVTISYNRRLDRDIGGITRHVWLNVRGSDLDDLEDEPGYPSSPEIVDTMLDFASPFNWSDNYGTRVLGYLHPDKTGYYTFYINGDSRVRLSLSTDDDPANSQVICETTRGISRDYWSRYAGQTSQRIWLEAGEKYFIDLLHKESWSSDHFAVAWTYGDEKRPRIINRGHLSRFENALGFDETREHYAYVGDDRTYYWPHQKIELDGEILTRTYNEPNNLISRWYFIQIEGDTSTAPVVEDPTSLDTVATISGPGLYYSVLLISGANTYHYDFNIIQVLDPLTPETRGANHAVWLNVYGNDLEDLTEHDPDLSNPSITSIIPNLEGPEDWAHFYGSHVKGYIHPAVSGYYKFWISADDRAALWLSTDDTSEAAEVIAYLPNRNSYSLRDYDRYDEQESAAIYLDAENKYYFEILHKENGGDDFFSVAWEGPGTNGREVVNAGHLSPIEDDRPLNTEILVEIGDDAQLRWPSDTLSLTAHVYDLVPGPQNLTYRWSVDSGPSNVIFSDATFPATQATFTAPGDYQLRLIASDSEHEGFDTIQVTVHAPLAVNAGGILRDVWLDTWGYNLDHLYDDENYPDAPHMQDVLPSMETPANWNDQYGTRLRGHLHVAKTGDYRFFISSNDDGALFLNPNGTAPEGIQRIAYTDSATSRYDWDRYDTQASQLITLYAGQSYYIEAHHKEYRDSDHLQVAWQGPDQDEPVIISGEFLSPLHDAPPAESELIVLAGDDQSWVWPVSTVELDAHVFDLQPGPQRLETTWSKVSGPGTVTFDVVWQTETQARFSEAGTYVLRLTATDGTHTQSDEITIELRAALAANTGSILREVYTDISGGQVLDLLEHESYPDSPAFRSRLTRLDTPQNSADRYGEVLRGYLHPPVTGNYRFNIASDDWGEMYLSRDDSPENKAIVCLVPRYTDYYEWEKYPEYQISAEIPLEAGQRYYIEIRHKDSSWRDHLSIAWLLPNADAMEIIEGGYLSPYDLGDTSIPVVQIVGEEEVTVTVGSTYVDLGATASDGVDGDLTEAIVIENSVDTSRAGTYHVRYRVYDSAANTSQEVVRVVNVVTGATTPAIYPADESTIPTPETWTPPASLSAEEAARFLSQASFGATEEEIARVQSMGIEAWIDEQLALPASLHMPEMERVANLVGENMMMHLGVQDRMATWWTHAVKADDQLRQRVAYALSQILVTSDFSPALRRYPLGVANYYDILVRNAFGDYRHLLEEVTLSPIMGIYLTMLRSTQASPDENYPREVLQLFSIGLHLLNTDGTPKTDSGGALIPTYGMDEILELSQAFTGWTFQGSHNFFYVPYNQENVIDPMMPFEEHHEKSSKVLLGGFTMPAGQSAYEDVSGALDNIAEHPNVGPFIVRRLIQHLVTSNPSPAYIYRTASVFNDNGSGVRGDLGAVVKAILLDPEARDLSKVSDPHFGKLREPILRLTHLFRAFRNDPSSNPPTLGRYVVRNTDEYFAQAPMHSHSVFNFFEPDFQQTGSIMDAELFSPEFEITTELTTVETSNFLYEGIEYGLYTDWRQIGRLTFDISDEIALAENNLPGLVDSLNLILFNGNMSADMRTTILETLQALEEEPDDIAKTALHLMISSPEFVILK